MVLDTVLLSWSWIWSSWILFSWLWPWIRSWLCPLWIWKEEPHEEVLFGFPIGGCFHPSAGVTDWSGRFLALSLSGRGGSTASLRFVPC